jgi:hypothetical protein
LAQLAGGGNLLPARQKRRHLVNGSSVPAESNGVHVAVWRQAAVFSPAITAENSPCSQSHHNRSHYHISHNSNDLEKCILHKLRISLVLCNGLFGYTTHKIDVIFM